MFRLYGQSDKVVDMFLKVFFPFISLSNIILDLGSSFPIYGSHMAVTNTTCMFCANWKLRGCYYVFFSLVLCSRLIGFEASIFCFFSDNNAFISSNVFFSTL